MTTRNTTDTSAVTRLSKLTVQSKNARFVSDIKNKARKTDLYETNSDGKNVCRGNLARLLNQRVFPNPESGDAREGDETITAPEGLGGDWGADLAETAEEKLWSMAYEHLGDDLKTRAENKFDTVSHNGIPDGSGLMRWILAKSVLTDSRAADRIARDAREEHSKSRMVEGVTGEEMTEWCDVLANLNSECAKPLDDTELVELTLEAFPDSIAATMEEKTEKNPDDAEDFDDIQVIWAAALDRHAQRGARRQQHALAAKSKSAPAADARDAKIDALTTQVGVLANALSAMASGGGGGGGGGGGERRPRAPPGTHPKCPDPPRGCGKEHPGGIEGCFMIHPEKVPKHFASMLYGIHKDRARANLPDLSEQYPAPARAMAAMAVVDAKDTISTESIVDNPKGKARCDDKSKCETCDDDLPKGEARCGGPLNIPPPGGKLHHDGVDTCFFAESTGESLRKFS